jgi:hypothetical protein
VHHAWRVASQTQEVFDVRCTRRVAPHLTSPLLKIQLELQLNCPRRQVHIPPPCRRWHGYPLSSVSLTSTVSTQVKRPHQTIVAPRSHVKHTHTHTSLSPPHILAVHNPVGLQPALPLTTMCTPAPGHLDSQHTQHPNPLPSTSVTHTHTSQKGRPQHSPQTHHSRSHTQDPMRPPPPSAPQVCGVSTGSASGTALDQPM